MPQETYSRTLTAMRLSDYEAAAVTTVGEFLDLTIPGRAFLPRAKNDPLTQRLVDDLRELHDLIQRDLTGQKLKNARGLLATYITEEWLSQDENGPSAGVMPPFIVTTPTKLEFLEDDPSKLGLKAGQKFIIEDGESRGESFLWLLESDTEAWIIEEMLNRKVTVVIHHNVPVATAGKWFADINGRGIGVNANLIVARDIADPYRDVARSVFPTLGAPLEEKARQVKATAEEVFTVLQARLAITAVAKGPTAVGYGAGRIPQNGTAFERLEAASSEWFGHVFETLGVSAFKDKEKVLRSVPVLVAVGAIGRPFYDGDEQAKDAARRIIADPSIDWSVGAHWAGICGKVNPNTGRFSVGSAKEYGNAAFNALTRVGTPMYKQIRHQPMEDAQAA
jgi:hypothetical protein